MNTPSPVAHKKQCTGTHTETRERQEKEGDTIDTVLQPALDEDIVINVATEARTLLDEHGQQTLERKGKQRVRNNDVSPRTFKAETPFVLINTINNMPCTFTS